jgi:hypothetical protein
MAFSSAFNFDRFLRLPPGLLPTADPVLSGRLATGEINVQVFPLWYSHASVSWSVPATWGRCLFHVYSVQAGEVTRLTTQPIEGPFFKDTTLRETSKSHSIDYVVEAILLDFSGLVKSSLPTSWGHKRRNWVELRATEIQRREFVLLSKFAGVKTFLFKRRVYGQRCTRCWNAKAEVVTDDNCQVCFGTSFEGGYFDAVPLFVQFDSSPNTRQNSYAGQTEMNSIGAWTISHPKIDPDDIVIRTGDWAAYNVSQIAATELQTVTVRQLLTLSQISKSDVERFLVTKAQAQEGASYLGEFPVTPAFVSPVEGQVQRFDSGTLTQGPSEPDWSREMDNQALPLKYTL